MRSKQLLIAISAVLILFSVGFVEAASLKVYYIDVGQGDSQFIVAPSGKTLLIDAGEQATGSSVVSFIQSLGYSRIDYVMASHYHADHLGGLDVVVNALQPSKCYDRGGSYSSTQYTQYASACSGKRGTLKKGNTIDLGAGITAKVSQANYGSDENGKSIVLKIDYGSLNLLFGGDCTSACEGTFSPGPIEVYKVHHHGSSTSTSTSFINNIVPDVSVIEVGAGNSYGHPTAQTLNRLAGVGSDVYRTDRDGTIPLVSASGTAYTVDGHSYTAS